MCLGITYMDDYIYAYMGKTLPYQSVESKPKTRLDPTRRGKAANIKKELKTKGPGLSHRTKLGPPVSAKGWDQSPSSWPKAETRCSDSANGRDLSAWSPRPRGRFSSCFEQWSCQGGLSLLDDQEMHKCMGEGESLMFGLMITRLSS